MSRGYIHQTRVTRPVSVLRFLLVSILLLTACVAPGVAITLVGGASTYIIARKSGANSTEQKAATDLQSYLKKITGVNLTITSYSSMSSVPAKAIVIGSLTTSPSLALEQVEMKVSGERLILRGGSALAHRYAVFTFLEDQLGCRFYTPTVEKVPTQGTVTISDTLNVTVTPSFEMRYLYQKDVEDNSEWCVKNRVNGQVAIEGTHNMYTYVSPTTYFTSHPEYFPMKGSTRQYDTLDQWLCFTNADLPAIIAAKVKSNMAGSNANTIINVSQGDDWASCDCAPCKAAYAAEGNSWSGVMLRCLNAAADIVAQTYPTRKMMTFAYMHTEKPGTTAPRSNLMIRLCHWQKCDLHGITECAPQDVFETNLAGWQNLTTPQQLYIWDYGTNFNQSSIIWPTVRSLIPNMQYYWNHDVRGMYYQGNYWANGGDLSWLKMYLLAKALWNKDVDATATFNDFLTGYYGDAGDEMGAYINYLEDRVRAVNWHPNGIMHDADDLRANLLTDAVLTQADAYYDAAEDAAQAVSTAMYNRVRYDRASLLYMHIYNRQQLSRISTPADRLVKNGDNRYYDWKEAFFAVIGNRGCGNEFRCGERSVQDLKAQQAGNVTTIENNKIKIAVCPWVQGAIISIIDKRTGKELLAPAKLQYDATNYPFNGYYIDALYKSDGSLYNRVAGTSTLTTLGDGSKQLTIVSETGIGGWSPTVDTHRITRTITLPSGDATSFTVSEKVKNIYTTAYTGEKLEGRMALLSCIDYPNITVTKPDNTTQAITTFPTTLNAKAIQLDNGRLGVRITKTFSTLLPTTSVTVSINSDGTFNATNVKQHTGTFNLAADEEKEVLNETWTLSEIPTAPQTDITWQDLYNTTADYALGSQLTKSGGTQGGWDADARSTQTLTGDGYVEWSFLSQGYNAIFALSTANPNHSQANLQYGIRTYKSGSNKYRVWESNAYKGTEQLHTSGIDRFRIERTGATIKYFCNGTLFYTSTTASTGTLFADCCILDVGSQFGFFNCVIVTNERTNLPPTVNLTAPANGAVFTAPASITLEATATDDVTVARVEFYNGSTMIGDDTSAPYGITWPDVPEGAYTLTAKAIDDEDAETTSTAVGVTIQRPGNLPPSVSLTAPTSNATFTAPSTITLEADASDEDGVVMKVEFFNGTTKVGEDDSAPFACAWTDVPAGVYSLTAKAYDDGEATTISTPVPVVVLRWITWKDFRNTTADYASGSKLTKNAGTSGWNGDAISTVSLTGDGYVEWKYLSQGSNAIFALNNNNANASSGSLKYGIRTYTSSGKKYYRPWEGNAYAGTAAEHTAGADLFRIERTGTTMKAYCNGTLIHTYSAASTTPLFADCSILDIGDHYGFYDCVIKDDAVTTTTPPTVKLTSPESGATFIAPASILIEVDASDVDGAVTKVEFYHDNIKLGEDATSPYSYTWSGVDLGTYSIMAKAIDDNGATTLSGATSVKVNDPPTVSLTTPENGASYLEPATILLEATASDTDGGVTLVEFYNGDEKLGEDDAAPYSFIWTDVPAGAYLLTARAVDNDGAWGSSATEPVTCTVTSELATVELTAAPASPREINTPITLTAAAVGGASLVYRFMNGAEELRGFAASPSMTWTPTEVGTHALSVIAKDLDGLDPEREVSSAPVNFTVVLPPFGVTLAANPPSPQQPNTPITLTATPVNRTDVEYRFFRVLNGVTTTLQSYSTDNTCEYTPTTIGTYQFIVWARERGHTTTKDCFSTITYKVNSSLTGVTLATGPNGPHPPGTAVTLTANQIDGGQVEYRFYAAEPGGGLQIIRPYGTANTCNFTVTQQGTYQFLVYAREVGSTAVKQAYASVTYSCATPITSVDLAAYPGAPQPAGVPLTLTATAHGGYRVQYRFFVAPPGGVFTTLQNYTLDDNICEYTPLTHGTYTFLVWVRETRSMIPSKDAYKVLTYTVVGGG